MDLPFIIQQCAPTVAPGTMMRIVSVESANRPYAIGYHITKDGKTFRLPRQPENQQQAVRWARWLLDNDYQFDAGAAQINSRNFKRFGLHAHNVFDLCTNIGTGAEILTEFYQRALKKYSEPQQALRAAISAYQTGSFTRGYQTGYVQKVLQAPLPQAPAPAQATENTRASNHRLNPQSAPTEIRFSRQPTASAEPEAASASTTHSQK